VIDDVHSEARATSKVHDAWLDHCANKTSRVGKPTRRGGRAVVLPTPRTFTRDQIMRHLNNYRYSLHAALRNSEGQFKETAPRKTAENTVKHRGSIVSMAVSQ